MGTVNCRKLQRFLGFEPVSLEREFHDQQRLVTHNRIAPVPITTQWLPALAGETGRVGTGVGHLGH
jgi:hypothetical protein